MQNDAGTGKGLWQEIDTRDSAFVRRAVMLRWSDYVTGAGAVVVSIRA